jgi:hypothetical protein
MYTNKTEQMTGFKDADLLRHNYREMDETGKNKLKEVSELIFNIWNTVNDTEKKCLLYMEERP